MNQNSKKYLKKQHNSGFLFFHQQNKALLTWGIGFLWRHFFPLDEWCLYESMDVLIHSRFIRGVVRILREEKVEVEVMLSGGRRSHRCGSGTRMIMAVRTMLLFLVYFGYSRLLTEWTPIFSFQPIFETIFMKCVSTRYISNDISIFQTYQTNGTTDPLFHFIVHFFQSGSISMVSRE